MSVLRMFERRYPRAVDVTLLIVLIAVFTVVASLGRTAVFIAAAVIAVVLLIGYWRSGRRRQ